jgi:phage tail protein X
MSSRYTYTNRIKNSDTKKSYLESTIYPKIKPSDNDLYIISEAGDRLDLLAYKYYNDTSLWWIISVANNLNDANFFVEPGLQIRIPSDTPTILNDLYKINK